MFPYDTNVFRQVNNIVVPSAHLTRVTKFLEVIVDCITSWIERTYLVRTKLS